MCLGGRLLNGLLYAIVGYLLAGGTGLVSELRTKGLNLKSCNARLFTLRSYDCCPFRYVTVGGKLSDTHKALFQSNPPPKH